jgi:hypothetical protein
LGGSGAAAAGGGAGLTGAAAGIGAMASKVLPWIAAAEAGVEGLGVSMKLMAASAEAAKGNTHQAVEMVADLGEEMKKLPLIGVVLRPLDKVLKFVSGANTAIAKIEKETAELDKKTEGMEARNKAARATNEKFTAVTKDEAARLAREGKSQPEQELADVRKQIADLEKLRKQNLGTGGFDAKSSAEAIAALRGRETSLVSDVAAERERQERKHQEAVTAIQAKGQAERLRAEGLALAAERAELVSRQQAESQALQDAKIGKPTLEVARIDAQLRATAATHAAELAAHDRKLADEEKPGGPQPDDDTAANFARTAGEGSVARERAREAVLRRRRDEQFEARQAELGVRGLDARARLEAAQHRAEAALAETEDPETRRAIQQRQAAELRAVLRDVDRPTLGEVVSDPTRTAFGRGGPGVGRTSEGSKEIDKTLRGDIKNLLRQIADNTKSAVAVTS